MPARRGRSRKVDRDRLPRRLDDLLDRRDPRRDLDARRAPRSAASRWRRSSSPSGSPAPASASLGRARPRAAPGDGRPRRRHPALGRRDRPARGRRPPARATGLRTTASDCSHGLPRRIRSAARSAWSLATGSYVVNDTMMKLATVGLPPYEVLVLRGIAAVSLGAAAAASRRLRPAAAADVRAAGAGCATSARLGGILCYVVALANMPIADVSALGADHAAPGHPRRLAASSASAIGGLRMALIGSASSAR